MDDLSRQVEEIEAISSIYENEWIVVDEFTRTFRLKLGQNSPFLLVFEVTLPINYPSKALPKYDILANWLKADERRCVQENIAKIGEENKGENVLFLWIEQLREFVDDKIRELEWLKANRKVDTKLKISEPVAAAEYQGPAIYHGEPFTDRKSTFQGHLAAITKPTQVQEVLRELLKIRKVANATHNIYAYRVFNEKANTYAQDCDDDGETAAGGRVLHLLQILDVRNVIVVVSRWYGGILLGSDRFKHINNAARNVLLQEGFIQANDKKSKNK